MQTTPFRPPSVSSSVEVEARFPPKLEFLFEPFRYKVAYGGRGGAKSWGFARALLIQGAQQKLRILCTREIQNSIKDSVHKLLSDQITALGLEEFYNPLQTEIRGKNGTEFIFSGLADKTAANIKSFEGVDRVWVEEAQTVSKRSWDLLVPTIRAPGSEIWVSFNPELDTDPTYQRFVLNAPPNSHVVKINYEDNPWFTPELEAERAFCERSDPADYRNIWLGECKAAVDGAIYAKEVTRLQEEGRVRNLPYDPMMKVHVICDLGFNDAMAIGLVQRQLSELRVIEYIEDSHRTLDDYSAQLKDKRLNWGKLYLPHDAKHKTLAADGLSTQDRMKKLGWDVEIVPDMGIEAGIRTARMALNRTYFDQTKTVRLVECLKRYRRSIPTTTGEPGAPVHDQYSHGADMFRYLSIVADQLTNETRKLEPIRYKVQGIV
jgi:phage terminase large subunit